MDTPTRIAIGSDHRGTRLKRELVRWLTGQGHQVDDLGTHSEDRVDYPDVAARVGQQVAQSQADRGILLCGTGIGMSIAANKVPGVRAATVHNEQEAVLSRRHNDLNVLCLPGEVEIEQLEQLIQIWLATDFEGGRHATRVDKIRQMESGC